MRRAAGTGLIVLCACAPRAPGGPAHTAPGGAVPVAAGVDVLLTSSMPALAGLRLGLITNQTGVTAEHGSTIDALHRHPQLRLVALFSPEHGIRGSAEAGEPVPGGTDDRTGLPVHSLYGATRQPTADMLADIDVLLFDIQDIGARYYTYVWTMALAMQAAAEHGVRFIVLDRPNPIGGQLVQGNVLEPAFSTFVGLYPVPMRHGMTAGELALLVNTEFGIGAALEVVALRGWSRSQWYDGTGLVWRSPSPNMPTIESALHYPGTCLFEGTNLSVGRGTPRPFQQIGAPWLDAEQLAARLNRQQLPGVRVEAVRFTPERAGDGKYEGREIAGIRFVATDRASYDPSRTAVAALVELQALHGDSLRFHEAHFDRLAGTDRLRTGVLRGASAAALTASWGAQLQAFEVMRRRYLLYPDS